MASPETFYASGDGYQRGAATTDYATARAMTTPALTTSELRVGQYLLTTDYHCYQTVLGFDTATLPDDCTITNVVLSLYGEMAMTGTGWTMQARAAANASAVAGADLAALTLLATGTSTSPGAYRSFASEAAFLSAVNKSGWTYINVSSSKQNAGTAPTDDERGYFESSAYAGTARDPKLVVTYTDAPPPDVALDATGTIELSGAADITGFFAVVGIAADGTINIDGSASLIGGGPHYIAASGNIALAGYADLCQWEPMAAVGTIALGGEAWLSDALHGEDTLQAIGTIMLRCRAVRLSTGEVLPPTDDLGWTEP